MFIIHYHSSILVRGQSALVFTKVKPTSCSDWPERNLAIRPEWKTSTWIDQCKDRPSRWAYHAKNSSHGTPHFENLDCKMVVVPSRLWLPLFHPWLSGAVLAQGPWTQYSSLLPNLLFPTVNDGRVVATAATVPRPFFSQFFKKWGVRPFHGKTPLGPCRVGLCFVLVHVLSVTRNSFCFCHFSFFLSFLGGEDPTQSLREVHWFFLSFILVFWTGPSSR